MSNRSGLWSIVFWALWGATNVSAQSPTAAQPDSTSDLSWLAGCWSGHGGVECWLAPLDGVMLGVNRGPARADKPPTFEFLRIVSDNDGIVFHASPGGRYPPTPFRAVEIGESRIVFANPDHDFPQRITYWLDAGDDKTLRARVEAKETNGEWQGFEMVWTRATWTVD